MAINKVQTESGEVLIDLTGDTVTAGKLATGFTAHDRSGSQITGTMESSGGNDYVGMIFIVGGDYGRTITLSDGSTPTFLTTSDGYSTYLLTPKGVTCSISYQYDALVAYDAITIDGQRITDSGSDRWGSSTQITCKTGYFDCIGVD